MAAISARLQELELLETSVKIAGANQSTRLMFPTTNSAHNEEQPPYTPMALNPRNPQLGMGLTEQVHTCQDPPDVDASRALFRSLPLLQAIYTPNRRG